MRKKATPRWIRLDELSELPPQRATELLAIAMTELGIAQGLAIIHGPRRAAQRYESLGAIVRFDAAGEPVIRVDAQPRAGT